MSKIFQSQKKTNLKKCSLLFVLLDFLHIIATNILPEILALNVLLLFRKVDL
jgi:hypothetical protein